MGTERPNAPDDLMTHGDYFLYQLLTRTARRETQPAKRYLEAQ